MRTEVLQAAEPADSGTVGRAADGSLAGPSSGFMSPVARIQGFGFALCCQNLRGGQIGWICTQSNQRPGGGRCSCIG